ncbi:hypothetical protein KKE74_01450 [Patescibacteria group bacterium]|nr:hypothetical protein [Patescibacteria group bacterium]MBU2472680.1 hypothetical protein [Patescibacteria group bacterium]
MAKFKEKIKAEELRKQGQSIKEIAKKLKVSKGSVSLWCRDIKLTKKQIKKLEQRMIKGGHKGRLKGAKVMKERRLERIKCLKKEALKEIGSINKRDLFVIGIGLYWGEGSKTDNKISFHNSDPMIIKFIMRWFKECFQLPKERFTAYVIINEIHKNRLDKVEKYWSKITKIPSNQFRKTVLTRVKNKKVYANFNNHYGTLVVRITKSSGLFYKIQGYIDSLV